MAKLNDVFHSHVCFDFDVYLFDDFNEIASSAANLIIDALTNLARDHHLSPRSSSQRKGMKMDSNYFGASNRD